MNALEGEFEPTEYVLTGNKCSREESLNLPSMYWKELNALERKVGTYRVCTVRKWLHWKGEFEPTMYVLKGNKCSREESCYVPSMYW